MRDLARRLALWLYGATQEDLDESVRAQKRRIAERRLKRLQYELDVVKQSKGER